MFSPSKIEDPLDLSSNDTKLFAFTPKNEARFMVSKNLSLPEIKKATKSLKITIKDMCLSAIGIALRSYSERHNIDDLKNQLDIR
jgi:hypothetical protein